MWPRPWRSINSIWRTRIHRGSRYCHEFCSNSSFRRRSRGGFHRVRRDGVQRGREIRERSEEGGGLERVPHSSTAAGHHERTGTVDSVRANVAGGYLVRSWAWRYESATGASASGVRHSQTELRFRAEGQMEQEETGATGGGHQAEGERSEDRRAEPECGKTGDGGNFERRCASWRIRRKPVARFHAGRSRQ